MTTRMIRRIGAIALSALAVFGAIGLTWGLVEPRVLDQQNQLAIIDDLPREWEGQRFVQLSDWQLGVLLDNPATVRGAVDSIVRGRPAFVLLTGDFIGDGSDDVLDELRLVTALLDPIERTGIPTFAVLGDRDYGIEADGDPPDRPRARATRAALEDAGVVVLHNEAVALRHPDTDAPLYIVGLAPGSPGLADPTAALAAVPADAARVVMMHDPLSYPTLPAGSAPVAIAGPARDGQVRVPPPAAAVATPYDGRLAGWATSRSGQEGNRLYVNRGIGLQALPVRINAPPELTWFILRRR